MTLTITPLKSGVLVMALAALGPTLPAQHPLRHPVDAVEIRYQRGQPVVSYVLRVDSADVAGYTVEMHVRSASDTFRVAMAAHPEYDDRFWRFVEGLRVESESGDATIAREDSALWRVMTRGGDLVVRYRVALPPPEGEQRAAWRPFLAPTGALVGGPHSFLYIVGAELAPAHVTLDVPRGWDVATGLTPTSDPHTYFAASAETLVDSPILAGRLRSWRFAVDGVPHRVAYWPLPAAGGVSAAFDTTEFVRGIEALVRQAVALFGRAPYREYTFLYQDGAYGGLEHFNSVTLGAPAATLAANAHAFLPETGHEFLHTWNLMRIRPVERTGISYRQGGRSSGLWFSEGLSIFYADLLARRAGLPTEEETRRAHLEAVIANYLSNPGNSAVSPERASFAEYGGTPGSLGDYDPSVHTQGEVLGTLLDIMVREGTNGRRSIDDVMRAMLDRYSGEHGFSGRDIERTVAEECTCNVRAFFADHVRGTKPIDFDRYLRPLGLRADVRWTPATGRDGRPRVDLRFYGWSAPGQRELNLVVTSPASAWGRAGLHTNDRLVAMNGVPIATWMEMRGVLSRLAVGDTLRVDVVRATGPFSTVVQVGGYDEPSVRLEDVSPATGKQRALRTDWLRGASGAR